MKKEMVVLTAAPSQSDWTTDNILAYKALMAGLASHLFSALAPSFKISKIKLWACGICMLLVHVIFHMITKKKFLLR